MKHPPYHLRHNKAVDRFMLVELLRKLQGAWSFDGYRYTSMGGPFLEDLRVVHEYFPEFDLESIESNAHTYNRQLLHKFTSKITMTRCSVADFISEYTSSGKEIVWLDYTDISFERIKEFMTLLNKMEPGCVLKLTLRADIEGNPFNRNGLDLDTTTIASELTKFKAELAGKYGKLVPNNTEDSRFRPSKWPEFLLEMLQLAAESVHQSTAGKMFQQLQSIIYDDGTRMISVVGLVCKIEERDGILNTLDDWSFANADWDKPIPVDVPLLSSREALKLAQFLPSQSPSIGDELHKELGYSISNSHARSLEALRQYASFYRYYPQFAGVLL